MKQLVIVESPTKVKTIKKYLPEGYDVVATYGHIKDLPKSVLGVDVEKDFQPVYETSKGKEKRISDIRKKAKTASSILIATDPDREGEAIGWHVAQTLGLITAKGNAKANKNKKAERIVFHEITKPAILDAIKHPRKIDMHLVDAQQARRVLDRLVGYSLSPLLWKKIRFGLSAGRVQSVALRLIVDREKERDAFKKEEYWTIHAFVNQKKSKKEVVIEILKKKDSDPGTKEVAQEPDQNVIEMRLFSKTGKELAIKTEADAKKLISSIKSHSSLPVSDIKEKVTTRSPFAPFTTSTLQQTAVNIFGFTSKRTMSIAQSLYEAGHITYMRTDSTNMSQIALKEIRTFVGNQYGKNYLSDETRVFKKQSKNAQEAHEAIRPTHVKQTADTLKLNPDQKKLYELIWQRAVATQMKEAKIASFTIESLVEEYLFKATFQKIVFDGFLKVYPMKVENKAIPDLKIGDTLYVQRLSGLQHFTQPPARYSEATIIKALEKFGIGRPSTYASIISTIMQRGYVEKVQRYLVPTDVGKIVTLFLMDNFDQIVDVDFTAEMEDDLDNIARGEDLWTKVIGKFYKPFRKLIDQKTKTVDRKDYTVLGKSKEKCPECGKLMIIKLGRYGKFLSCSNFPECKGMKSLDEDKAFDVKSPEFKAKYAPAPETEEGKPFELKTGRYGKFWAHPDYPKVKDARPMLLKEKCPECGKNLIERTSKWKKVFIGCSGYPDCKFIKKAQKKEEEK